MKKVPCVGFSISGRICAREHMTMLSMMVRVIKEAGWGVVVPLQTPGEKHIARECHRQRVFCVGLFTNKHCSPEFRGSLAMEVDTYLMSERQEVSELYNAIGKQFQWDMMPEARRALLASTVSLAQLSRLIAVWPESTETSVAAAVAGGRRLPVYYLPTAYRKIIQSIMDDRRVQHTSTTPSPTRTYRVGGK